jgi:hypothetical protein
VVVWDEDNSVSVVTGKIMVTPADTADRTVGAISTVKTSHKGPHHPARIAGRGEGCVCACSPDGSS